MVDRYYSWHDLETAVSMRDLALRDLARQDWKTHPPFKHFLQAMGHVTGRKLLDMGCGVGHYSEIMSRAFSKWQYSGVDFSPVMIEEAKRLWPGRDFRVGDVGAFDCSQYDVILLSSLIEVMDDWLTGVEGVCATASAQVLLHRVRIHNAATERQDTIGYGSQLTYTWVHDEQELWDAFGVRGFDLIWFEHWQEYPQATYIFERS